jgi:hypothetical protein
MRCPVCRAEIAESPQCRRCRADLSLLFTLQAGRNQAMNAAYQCVARNQLGQALAIAGEMDASCRDDDSKRLLALIQLLRGDFAQAWRHYSQRFLRATAAGNAPHQKGPQRPQDER